eukprot:UN06959
MAETCSNVFKEAVPRNLYPNYYIKIRRPMWLHKVRDNLYGDRYKNIKDFDQDMKQIWINAREFNPSQNQVHQWAIQLSNLYEGKMDQYNEIPDYTTYDDTNTGTPQIVIEEEPPVKKLERWELLRIESHFGELPEDVYDKCVEMITACQAENVDSEEMEIEIATLPAKVQLELYNIVCAELKFGPEPSEDEKKLIEAQKKEDGNTMESNETTAEEITPPEEVQPKEDTKSDSEDDDFNIEPIIKNTRH